MTQINDYQIQTYIDQAFNKYDVDQSGSLDVNELARFFN